jgi:DNA polymerase I-like protein with 3'-5' exonuclease and polymerase domains
MSFPFPAALKKITKLPTTPQKTCAFDWESTGIHLHHGDLPFMLCMTFDDKTSLMWEAEVDPLTRQPIWSQADLLEIEEAFSHSPDADEPWQYVATNAKFDVACTALVLSQLPSSTFSPEKFLLSCHDTIGKHHALVNNESHALKDAAVKHAGMLDDDEKDLHEASKQARLLGRQLGFKVASKENCPQQRKAPKKGWAVMDMWLPRAVAKHQWESSQAFRFLQKHYQQEISSYSPENGDPEPPDFSYWCTGLDKFRLLQQVQKLSGWEWHPPEVWQQGAHSWWTICAKYCCLDTIRTLVLDQMFTATLQHDNLWDQYIEHRTSLPISFLTEQRGLTVNLTKAEEMIRQYEVIRDAAQYQVNACLNLPSFKITSTDSLRSILYGYFKLPVTRLTKPKNKDKKGNPTTDSDFFAETIRGCLAAMKEVGYLPEDYTPPEWQKAVETPKTYKERLRGWYKILDPKTDKLPQLLAFATGVMRYKKAVTAISYLRGYIESAEPVISHLSPPESLSAASVNYNIVGSDGSSADGHLTRYGRLYPSLNPYGTRSTRYTGANPNPQNVSKGGKGKKGMEWLKTKNFSLRSVFGPIPGREWWRFDYHQIQLVIFAILSGDEQMQQAAHDGKDFHTFMACKIFGYTEEQFALLPEKPIAGYSGHTQSYCRDIAKTVNFAFIFGAQEEKLNRTAGMSGLYAILQNVFPAAVNFLERTEWEVRRKGCVYTPGGYRLFIPEDKAYSGVNYKVQGAEGEIVKRAMYGIQAYFDQALSNPLDMYMTLYVHDELLFDSKKGFGISQAGNIVSIMNDAAESFGMPAKAECELCSDNWADSTKIAVVGSKT